nr:MAG TPA: hypothetical protein [Caudoviricetes sp.]
MLIMQWDNALAGLEMLLKSSKNHMRLLRKQFLNMKKRLI